MNRNDSGRPWPAGIWWATLTVLPAVRAPGLHGGGLGCFMCSHLFNWYFDQCMHYKLSF